MDEEKRKKELQMLVASVRAFFNSLGRPSGITINAFLEEYRREEGRELPYAKYGYTDPTRFLIEEAEFQRSSNGLLTYFSEKSKHIIDMLGSQKAKPKLTAPAASHRSCYRPEPEPFQRLPPVPKLNTYASSLGLNNQSQEADSLSFENRPEIISFCQKAFTQPFRHELRVKLKNFPNGCTPDEFVEYFNRSNFERFKFRKDLDLKGLSLMDFCRGLPDVFRIETEDGVVKLHCTLTKSLSLNKLGNRGTPKPSFNILPSQSYRSTSDSSGQSLPTINEMSVIFKQVCESYAGREVSMNDYLKKVGELGHAADGKVEAWLRMQRFDMAKFSEFITERLNLPIDLVPGKDAIFVRGPPRLERLPSAQASAATSNNLSLPTQEPFSIVYNMERLPLGGGSVDIEVTGFDVQEPNFYFTLAQNSQRRLDFMKRLRKHELVLLPRGQLKKGVHCLVAGENNALYRSSVLEVSERFLEVYCVDTGETNTVPVDQVYHISDEYLRENVYAYPATIANVRPVGGNNKFDMKTLQDIAIELENSVVKATILRFNESSKRYEVDLGETAMSLHRDGLLVYTSAKPSPVMMNGFHSTSAPTNGTQPRPASTNGFQQTSAQTNGHASTEDSFDVTVEKRVLPNCETIAIVQRDSCNFILASDVSRVLGASHNTFLTTLANYCIGVTGSWKPSCRVLEQLRANDNSFEPTAGDVLLPISAVAPLMRAFLWIEGRTLENEKYVLRAFRSMTE